MQPLVSIGLPVYNGENYLREALNSLLAQDYENFELIISDNASTDFTAKICKEYVACDERVKYFHAKQNKGASWNFNRVLDLSKGEFFMWAAHDDLWHPSFISKCVEALLQNVDAAICHSQGQNITVNGEVSGDPYVNFTNEEETVRGRWQKVHKNWHLHAAIYGLIRTSVAKKALPVTTYASADLLFIAEVCLFGKIIQLPEVLQYNRLPAVDAKRYKSPEGMMEYLGANSVKKVQMHRLRILIKSIKILSHAKLSLINSSLLLFDLCLIYLKSQFLIDIKELIKSQITDLKQKKFKSSRI